MNEIIIYIINLFASLLKNYPLTIICVTLLFKLVIMPLDLYQKKNSRKTAALSEEVESIKKRYKDQNQQNQKIQELYRKNGVNTLATGCLPLIVQIVLLFAFFGALRTLMAQQTSSLIIDAAINGADKVKLPGWLWINNFWQPDSGFSSTMPSVDELFKFLQQNISNISPENLYMLKNSGIINFGADGITIVTETYEKLSAAVLSANGLTGLANGWFGLPILTGITTWLSQKLSMANQDEASAEQMKSMMFVMPFMSGWFCLTSNSGFAVYWLVSNIYQIIFALIINAVYKAKDNKAQKA